MARQKEDIAGMPFERDENGKLNIIDDENIPAKDPEPKRMSDEAKDDKKQPDDDVPVKITSTVKKDIQAKVSVLLLLPAGVWTNMDPVCGSHFQQTIPDLSVALTDIICGSNDMVKWFTKSGSFMNWLALFSVLQPVAVTIWQHHVSHKLDDEGYENEPADYSAYSAPRF